MRPPILRDFPDSFETERLLIRVPRPGDGPELNAAVLETFESLKRWMPWAQERPTVERSEEYCREMYSKFLARADLALFLFLKRTNTLVGASGLHPRGWEVPKFEIGYWRRSRFEGQGYITEAVRGITTFAFETVGARRVQIQCDRDNERSRRVAERAGYRLEGELRNDDVDPNGRLRTTLLFAMIPEEYEALKEARSNHG